MMTGGTYWVGGTKEAWLNVTYNYSSWYYANGVFPNGKGICSIYGKSGAESISILKHAIEAIRSTDGDFMKDEIEKCEDVPLEFLMGMAC